MGDEERVAGYSDFGDLLRRHRLAAGLSQEELAERARMSANGVGALERGYRRTPQRETLVLLAEALQLSEEERKKFEATAGKQRSRLASGGSPTVSKSSYEMAEPSPEKSQPVTDAAGSRRTKMPRLLIAIVLALVAVVWFAKSAWPTAANSPIQPSPSDVNDLEKSETAFWPAIYDTPQPLGSYAPDVPAKVGRYNGHIVNINAATWTTYFHGYADDSVVIQLNSQAQKLPAPAYVDIPITGQPVIDPRKSFSVSAAIWFVGQTTTSRQGGYTILSEGDPSPFVLRLNRSGFAEFIVQSRASQLPSPEPWIAGQPSNLASAAHSSLPPTVNDRVALGGPLWYVVLGVYDSSQHVARLYVNGACKGAQHVDSTLSAMAPLILGAREGRDSSGKTYIGDLFEGRIAQVVMFDHSLSQSEARTLYWIIRQNLFLPSAQIDATPTPGPLASRGLCDG